MKYFPSKAKTVLVCILLLVITTSSNAFVYVVKEHDKFSKILGKYIPGPVWGRRGSYEKFLSFNPQIKNPNLILPGDEINLPVECALAEEKLPGLTREPAQVSTPVQKNSEIKPELNSKLALKEEASDDLSGTELELTPFFTMSALTAKDLTTGTRTTVASNIYAGVDARYIQIWNENFKTFIRAKLSDVTFQPPSASGKTLSDGSKFLSTFGIGGTTNLSSRIGFSLYGNLEKDLFIRALSTTSVTVDSVMVPSLGAKLSYDLVKLKAFTLNVAGVYEEKFQATTDSYTVGQGALYGGIIGVRQHNPRGDMFQIDLAAFTRPQNTSATTQTETTYTLSLKFFFSLIKPEENGSVK